MRLRLLAFVPPAAVISAALLMSASSLVSALESKLTPTISSAIPIQRYESACDLLEQEIEALSRAATSCDQDIQCLGSPILCPIAMDEGMQQKYRELRLERREKCGGGQASRLGGVSHLIEATSGIAALMDLSTLPFEIDANACYATQTWLESAASDEVADPSIFVF